MHVHDENKQSSWMMWVMMLCCALPLLLILIFGAGGKALGFPTWVVIGGIAVMAVAHFFMMGRPRKHTDSGHEMTGEEDKNKENKNNKNHSGHGRCH